MGEGGGGGAFGPHFLWQQKKKEVGRGEGGTPCASSLDATLLFGVISSKSSGANLARLRGRVKARVKL